MITPQKRHPSKPLGEGEVWTTYGWTGVCHRFSESYPFIITKNSHHSHFYDEFFGVKIDIFGHVLPIPGKPNVGKSAEKGAFV